MANEYRVSQEPVEVVETPTDGTARVSQEPVEVVETPTDGTARVSQEPVEVVLLPTDGKARLGQQAVEVVATFSNVASLSQLVVESVSAFFEPDETPLTAIRYYT